LSDIQEEDVGIAVAGIEKLCHTSFSNFIHPQIHSSQVGVLLDGMRQLDGSLVCDIIPCQVEVSDPQL